MKLPIRPVAAAAIVAIATLLMIHGITAPPPPTVSVASTSAHHGTRASHQGKSTATASTPLLQNSPYASAAYEIYPHYGQGAHTAVDGFTFTFHAAGATSETVTVGAAGQSGTLAHQSFALTDKLYFIETSLGDDQPAVDLNGGDDGLILTDAVGHILR